MMCWIASSRARRTPSACRRFPSSTPPRSRSTVCRPASRQLRMLPARAFFWRWCSSFRRRDSPSQRSTASCWPFLCDRMARTSASSVRSRACSSALNLPARAMRFSSMCWCAAALSSAVWAISSRRRWISSSRCSSSLLSISFRQASNVDESRFSCSKRRCLARAVLRCASIRCSSRCTSALLRRTGAAWRGRWGMAVAWNGAKSASGGTQSACRVDEEVRVPLANEVDGAVRTPRGRGAAASASPPPAAPGSPPPRGDGGAGGRAAPTALPVRCLSSPARTSFVDRYRLLGMGLARTGEVVGAVWTRMMRGRLSESWKGTAVV